MNLCKYFLSITLLFMPCVFANETVAESRPAKFVQDYQDPIHFMTEFLDTNVKPEQPLSYWMKQLAALLLKSNRTNKVKDFCTKLRMITERTVNVDERTRLISDAFIAGWADQLFSPELSQFIISKKDIVRSAIKTRATRVN